MKVTNQRFSDIRWIDETGSTNRDLVEAAAEGMVAGAVLVTDHQTAGRGRQGRTWVDDPGRSLLFSVLLRPDAEQASVLPLVMGMGVVDAIRKTTGVNAALKWPNDVLAIDESGEERKMAGILAEATTTSDGLAVVVGCGINVAFVTGPPEEVRHRAIDLASAAKVDGDSRDGLLDRNGLLDREALLEQILDRLDHWLTELERHGPAAIIEAYRPRCCTLGRSVTLETASGEVTGQAVDIDPSGALVIEVDGTRQTVFAGDAHHRA